MKIVNGKTLLSLPKGTVFCWYYEDIKEFGQMAVKQDSNTICFLYQEVVDVDCEHTGEYMDILKSSEEKGTEFKLNFTMPKKELVVDDGQLYAVFNKNDVLGLIGLLTENFVNAYGE
jgi:hypothetical protein